MHSYWPVQGIKGVKDDRYKPANIGQRTMLGRVINAVAGLEEIKGLLMVGPEKLLSQEERSKLKRLSRELLSLTILSGDEEDRRKESVDCCFRYSFDHDRSLPGFSPSVSKAGSRRLLPGHPERGI